MTEEEVRELARLLRKLSAERLGLPNLPKEVFMALKGVVRQPTVELLITRDGRDLLLTERRDAHWDHWHLPGGFVGAEESLEEACARVGQRELGVKVTMRRLVGHYSWPHHPYATALSLLCLCEVEGEPRDGRFFMDLPSDLLGDHRAALARCWPEPAARSA